MEHQLQRIGRKLAYRGAILDFYQDEMRLPNGQVELWDFISHRKGGACIVPVLPDGRLILIRQYRPAIGRETLELPAGARDGLQEDTLETAKRELREETGYITERIRLLLKLKTAVAYCDEFTDVYLAEQLQRDGEQQLDAAEEIRLEIYPLETLLQKIYAGEIQDAKTVAGITAYAAQMLADR